MHMSTHKINGRTRLQWIELIMHHEPNTFDRSSLRTIARPDIVALQYGLKKPRHSKRLASQATRVTVNVESGTPTSETSV